MTQRFSFVALLAFSMLTPAVSFAGFEFVSPTAAPAPAIKAPVEMPVISNAPVAAEPLPVSPSAPAPVIVAPAVSAPVAPAPVTLPVAEPAEPMQLGVKAVPLTPLVKESDALVIDDQPILPPPAPAAMALPPIPADTIDTGPMPLMPAAKEIPAPSEGVLWDNDAVNAAHVVPVSPPAPEMAAAPLAPAAVDDAPIAEGFGRQVPLVMALQQIVPSDYRYSFDMGVDPGMRVNWTGGKSWKAVITDIAQANKLNVDIVSNVVAFRRVSPMDTVLTPMIPPEPIQVPENPLPPMEEEVIAPKRDILASTDSTKMTESAAKKAAPAKPKKETASDKERSFFDRLFDKDVEKDAKNMDGTVKNKEILTAEEEAVSAPAEAVAAMAPVETVPVIAPKTEEAAPINLLMDAKPAESSGTMAAKVTEAPFLPPPVALPPLPDENAPLPPVASSAKIVELPPLGLDQIQTPVAPKPVEEMPMAKTADLNATQEWTARKDETLRQTLKMWGEQAGVSLVWSSEYDYPLQTDVRIKGTYPEAIRTLLAGFNKAQPRPLGRLFKNKEVGAQPVLMIETQRLTN